MRKLLLLCLAITTLQMTAQSLYPVINANNNQYGFINNNGKVVIDYQYELILPFQEGLAAVYIDGKWGYINKENKLVIANLYEETYGFVDGLAAVKKGDHFGYIDSSGNEVIPFKYLDAINFSCGRAAVLQQDSQWVFVDMNNQVIIKRSDLNIRQFSSNFSDHLIYNGFMYGFILGNGEKVNDKYVLFYYDVDGNKVFFKNQGMLIGDSIVCYSLPDTYDKLGKQGFINLKTSKTLPPIYNNINRFHNEYSWAEKETSDSSFAVHLINSNGIVLKKVLVNKKIPEFTYIPSITEKDFIISYYYGSEDSIVYVDSSGVTLTIWLGDYQTISSLLHQSTYGPNKLIDIKSNDFLRIDRRSALNSDSYLGLILKTKDVQLTKHNPTRVYHYRLYQYINMKNGVIWTQELPMID